MYQVTNYINCQSGVRKGHIQGQTKDPGMIRAGQEPRLEKKLAPLEPQGGSALTLLPCVGKRQSYINRGNATQSMLWFLRPNVYYLEQDVRF